MKDLQMDRQMKARNTKETRRVPEFINVGMNGPNGRNDVKQHRPKL
jgi:hypothetical protein